MKRKYVLISAVIIILGLFGYLLFPLESDQFEIAFDQEKYRQKLNYLANNSGSPADSGQTNILWILVDDLGMSDTDLYTNGPVQTPALNSLADEGILFTNAYVSSPVCSPSRAAIATGRYNQRFGFEHQMHERYLKNRLEYYGFRYFIDSDPWVPQYQTEVPPADFLKEMGLPKSEITLAEVVKKYGYQTEYIGKWHLGKKDEKAPNQFGFDHFYGFYSSHSLYSPEGTEGIVDQKIPEDFTDQYIWEGQRNDLQAIRENGEVVREERYLTQAITSEAIDYLEEVDDEPFYLWVSYNAPHTPLQAPEEYVDLFKEEKDPIKRVHYAMIKCLDDEIGRLMDYLEASGKSDNTLIILLSDNGGAEYNLTTQNGRFQGGKITNFEGGVKVPMIMKWPGKVEPGIFEKPVHATDAFVTSAAAAGTPLPDDRIYDGVDLLPHIRNNTTPHEYIYFEMGRNRGIRSEEWKLTWNEHNGDTLLYHLASDPFEQQNVYPQHKDVIAELSTAFSEWSDDNIEAQWPPMIWYYYTADDGSVHYFDE